MMKNIIKTLLVYIVFSDQMNDKVINAQDMSDPTEKQIIGGHQTNDRTKVVIL